MNVLKTPSQTANLSYNGFDMSQLTKFSSTLGELLPVYHDILYPGDKVAFSTALRTRTMPIDSAAMTSIIEHIDWFAVPLDQIYKFASMNFYGISDINSSNFDKNQLTKEIVPYLSVNSANAFCYGILHEGDAYFNHSDFVGSGALRGTGTRLMELLGIPLDDYASAEATGAHLFRYSINPMLFCAYQKIYMDYFRITDREQNQPLSYNLDLFYSDGEIVQNFSVTKHMGTLRYRPKARDFFTHTYVSPLFEFGGVSSGPNNLVNDFHQWLTSVSYAANNSDLQNQSPRTQVNPSQLDSSGMLMDEYNLTRSYGSGVTQEDFQKFLSPQAIRTSFAVNKLLEVTRRAGKHIDQQTLAHFGVKPSSFVTGEVRHLAHHSQKVVIGDVISTAETSDAALGQVGGKGYGFDKSRTFKYQNNEACPVILMAIYSADVAMDYKPLGIDKFNLYVDNADWYRPEFDNLGMQPLFGYQSCYNGVSEAFSNWDNVVLGWQYRWMESKLKVNRVCGALARNLENWSTFTTYMRSDLRHYLVSPFSLNSIMVKGYEFDSENFNTISAIGLNPGTSSYKPSSAFDSDPLIHELYCDVKKSSTMSAFGLEQL